MRPASDATPLAVDATLPAADAMHPVADATRPAADATRPPADTMVAGLVHACFGRLDLVMKMVVG